MARAWEASPGETKAVTAKVYPAISPFGFVIYDVPHATRPCDSHYLREKIP
jgi:hypothetical protein